MLHDRRQYFTGDLPKRKRNMHFQMLVYVKKGLSLKQTNDQDVSDKFQALSCPLASNSKISVDNVFVFLIPKVLTCSSVRLLP